MVLNAVNKKGEVICPAEMIEAGADKGRVFKLVRLAQRQEPYYCPECLGKYNQYTPVGFVGSEVRRCHFAHNSKSIARQCSQSVSESEKHLTAKRVIAKRLELDHQGKLSEVHIDDRFFYGDGVASKRKPDIWLQFVGGAYEVHEVQLSRIDSAELDARTQDLRSFLRSEMMDAAISRTKSPNGFTELAAGQAASVHWYMSPRNLNDEIRAWAADQNGVFLYRLTFDKDTCQPTWLLDQKLTKRKEKILTRRRKSKGRTTCSHKPTPIISPATWAVVPNQPSNLARYTLFYDEAYERYAVVLFDWQSPLKAAQFEWVPKSQLFQLNESILYAIQRHLMYVDYAKGAGLIRFQQVMNEKKDVRHAA